MMAAATAELRRKALEDAEASCMRVERYLDFAITQVDRLFGAGYAATNPALVGSFMQAAATDFHSHSLRAEIDRITDALRAVERGIEDIHTHGIGVRSRVAS